MGPVITYPGQGVARLIATELPGPRSIGVHARPALLMVSHGKSYQALPRKLSDLGCSGMASVPEKNQDRGRTRWERVLAPNARG